MLDLELLGKVALVTGGSDGLGAGGCGAARGGGRESCDLCAAAGAVGAGGGGTARRPAARSRRSSPTLAAPRTASVFVAEAVSAFGGVDILLNNAGTSAASGLEEVDDAAWYADIDLKLMAAVRLCRAVIPLMRARDGGAIVNATTVGGRAPAALGLPTTVTRAAGINLTKSLANGYRDEHDLHRAARERAVAAPGGYAAGSRSLAEMDDRVPLGRMGEAEEYADLVAFLVSARAAAITGTAINLDGGMGASV